MIGTLVGIPAPYLANSNSARMALTCSARYLLLSSSDLCLVVLQTGGDCFCGL